MGNKVFYNKQFSNYLGEQRAILDVIVGAEQLPPSPSPTPSISLSPTPTFTPTATSTPLPPSATPTLTPTPTRTPAPTQPVGPYTQQFFISSNDANDNITGSTWSVVWNGITYNGTIGNNKYEEWFCVDAVYPQVGDLYTLEIGTIPAGYQISSVSNYSKITWSIDSFAGIIFGTYRWNATQTLYSGATPISSTSVVYVYDPTPSTNYGCELDIIAGGNQGFFIENVGDFCIDLGFDQGTQGTIISTGDTAYVFGGMEFYDGNEINKIARISTTSGLLDNSFVASFPNDSLQVNVGVEDSLGNLYLGGSFTSYAGFNQGRLIKIDRNANRIDTFNVGPTGFAGGSVFALVLDEANNALYVGGAFTTYTGGTASRIIKLNATTAERDATFNPGTAFNGIVYDMVLDGSGGLYVAGSFTTFTGATNNRIIKLNATTGAKDTTFVNTTGFNSTVNNIRWTGTHIVAAGVFSTYKGATASRIARIDATGTLDATFPVSSAFNGNVNGMSLDGSGRAVCVGAFTSYSGINATRIARINTDGTLDTTFQNNVAGGFLSYLTPGQGGNQFAVAFDASQNIYIAGAYTSFAGQQLNNYLKLNFAGTNQTFNNCGYPQVTPTPSTTPVVTDSDAQTYVATLIANGALGLTRAVQSSINTLFIDLKNAGIYNKIYAMYPMWGTVYDAIKYNAKNPGNTDAEFRWTATGAPTYSTKGVKFNAVASTLNTYFNPTTQGVAADSFCMFSFTTISGATGYDIGGASASAFYGLGSNSSGNFRAEVERAATTIMSTTGATLGFQAVSRVDGTNQYWVRDGGAVQTSAQASNGAIANVNIFIGGYNGVGEITNRGIGTCGLAQGLTDTELADLRDIITTFENSLPR